MSQTSIRVGDLVDAVNASPEVTRETGMWVRIRGYFYQVVEFRVDHDQGFIIEVEDD